MSTTQVRASRSASCRTVSSTSARRHRHDHGRSRPVRERGHGGHAGDAVARTARDARRRGRCRRSRPARRFSTTSRPTPPRVRLTPTTATDPARAAAARTARACRCRASAAWIAATSGVRSRVSESTSWSRCCDQPEAEVVEDPQHRDVLGEHLGGEGGGRARQARASTRAPPAGPSRSRRRAGTPRPAAPPRLLPVRYVGWSWRRRPPRRRRSATSEWVVVPGAQMPST